MIRTFENTPLKLEKPQRAFLAMKLPTLMLSSQGSVSITDWSWWPLIIPHVWVSAWNIQAILNFRLGRDHPTRENK